MPPSDAGHAHTHDVKSVIIGRGDGVGGVNINIDRHGLVHEEPNVAGVISP